MINFLEATETETKNNVQTLLMHTYYNCRAEATKRLLCFREPLNGQPGPDETGGSS